MTNRTATDPAQFTPPMLARTECQARLEAGQAMALIDQYIDALPIDERDRDAVRLFAWAYGERTPPR